MSEKKVYAKIAAVMAEMAKEGIGKDRSNQQQGYKFRGIDDVYNALAGPMSRNGLVVLPRITEREVVERINKNGTALFYVTVKAEFDFVAAEDGSYHTVATYGEAMDSGDKATNKAMSAAFKYACMQAFCIPTEGDNDADAHTHEVKPQERPDSSAISAEVDSLIKNIQAAPDKAAFDMIWAGAQELRSKVKAFPDKAVAKALWDAINDAANKQTASFKGAQQ